MSKDERGFGPPPQQFAANAERDDVLALSERYSGLLESMPDAIVIVDAQGAIVLFNDEATRLFGLSADEALGRPVELLLPPAHRTAHTAHRAGYAAQPQRRTMGSGLELFGLHARGHCFPVEVSLSPLVVNGRHFVVSAIRDVSQRKQWEQALVAAQSAERASAAKTEFLSRMSHELRTPLNAVLGFSQLLLVDARQPLPAAQFEQVRQIERAGRHLLSMIDDVLDVARIESGTLALSLEPLRLVDVVAESLALIAVQAAQAGIDVHPAQCMAELHVRADRLRLRQVLLNLLSNAVKYNRPGGSVVTTVGADAATVTVTVSDTGFGMTPAQLDRLFQPFNRLGAERSGIEGTGIGLVIARHLAESMGGALHAMSEPGQGSAFALRLPACAPLPAPVPAAAGPVSAPAPGAAARATRSLLYIEDNAINVALMRAALEQRPLWRLRVAHSGQEALAEVRRERPDLLLVDMHLGDTDGLALVRAIDRLPGAASTPRVALSADAMPAHVQQALDAGFERYLTKPVDLDALYRCLDEHASSAVGTG